MEFRPGEPILRLQDKRFELRSLQCAGDALPIRSPTRFRLLVDQFGSFRVSSNEFKLCAFGTRDESGGGV